MSLLSLLAAFLLEQFHPLSSRRLLFGWVNRYADFFSEHFNAGEHRHGKIAWLLAAGTPVFGVSLLYWVLLWLHPFFAWLACVAVLYLTLGFRRFSHDYSAIQTALREHKLESAREILSAWCGFSCQALNESELASVTIEQALLASVRNVFGVVVWFVIFMLFGLGPVGAILYRFALFLKVRWSKQTADEFSEFGQFARQVAWMMEWLPMRLTAMMFAIVGDFEETIYCWRTQAKEWPDTEEGIVLASGAGALGVRLGLTLLIDDTPLHRPELGIDEETDVDFMQSATGLVWRALVFLLVLLLLMSLASLLG